MNCPACNKPIVSPHASHSRYVNLFICSDCGKREAFEEFFWEKKFDTEKPTQPVSYNPWAS